MTVLAIIVLSLYGILLLCLLAIYARVIVNPVVVTAQIQKLVMARAIDRAVKLCNAAPNALYCQATLVLLLHANRTYRLELEFQNGLFAMRSAKDRITKFFWVFQWGLPSLAVLSMLTPEDPNPVLLYITAGVFLLCVGLWWKIYKGLSIACDWLPRTRDLLLAREEYVPPQYRPRKMTKEQLEEWRKSMDSFEADMVSRKGQGETLDVNEEHDKVVRKDGVLPPL